MFSEVLYKNILFFLILSPGLQMIGTKWYQIVPMVLVFKGQLKFHSTELTSPLYVHITLATDAETESPCFAQLLQR